MPKVVVRHDLPIASGIEGRRDGLDVVDASNETVGAELADADVFVVNPANWRSTYLSELRQGNLGASNEYWIRRISTREIPKPWRHFL